jgi:protein-disulfide isomerase
VYGDKVRIIFKHFPLDIHKDAVPAALASVAAFEQGKFWEFHDKLFANQQKLPRPFLIQYARELGLNAQQFEAALESPPVKSAVDADVAEAKSLGITGTPGFFVNGRFLSGAKPFEEFARVIDEELTRLKLPVPAAAPNVP